LSAVLPRINIYVCIQFNFKLFCTFQDMAQTGIHYEINKWLRGNNYVNIQGRIMVLVHCPSPDCHLSINQVPIQSLLYFQDMARTHIHYEQKKWLRGDNTVNIQGMSMVLMDCPSSHCHLSLNQVSFQSLLYFPRYCSDRHPL